jgi:hypothetical protein
MKPQLWGLGFVKPIARFPSSCACLLLLQIEQGALPGGGMRSERDSLYTSGGFPRLPTVTPAGFLRSTCRCFHMRP